MSLPTTSPVWRLGLVPTETHADSPESRASLGARRRAHLAAEARRLDRRRAMAEAVSSRCEPGSRRGLDPHYAGALRLRALRRAATLKMRFLRAIDSLVLAGGFDEAMTILRERGHAPRPSRLD